MSVVRTSVRYVEGEIDAAMRAIQDAVRFLQSVCLHAQTNPQVLARLDALKTIAWQWPSIERRFTAHLVAEADPHQFGEACWREVLSLRLRITRAEANRRLRAARRFGPRRALTGEELPAELAHVAEAVADGRLGPEHENVIRKTLDRLPGWVDDATRDRIEADLTAHGSNLDADGLRKVAQHLVDLIDPDGAEPDEDLQQRRRSLVVGPQGADGMREVRGRVDPVTGALLDVVIAKHGAPHTRDGELDTRSQEQRNHDALRTALSIAVDSKEMGQLNGIPATIVVTTTLGELESAAGWAHTGGGTRLPMRDVIAAAANAHHYLAVFDDHTEEVLYLGRAKRNATAAQRLALFARDRGCTKPGCSRPFYQTQAHHAVKDFAAGGNTDIDELALACQPHNNLIEQTDWRTTRTNGRTQWIPPQPLDTGQPRINNYHHPQRYLTERHGGNDDDGG